jgi:hypothetical protein
MATPARIPTKNYVAHFDPLKPRHRTWLQAVLDRLQALDPATLQDGGELRKLWMGTDGLASVPAGSGTFDKLMPLLDLIAQGEGNYNSINRGRAGDTPGGRPGLDRMTIAQVMELQRGGVFAVGRYQFIPETLKIAARDAGVAPSDMFNPEGQDMLATALLLGGKRPLLRDYLLGKDVPLETAQLELAKEWASIPMANGRGFYDGDSAGNRASAKVAEVQRALRQARESLAGKTLQQLRLPAQQEPKPMKLPPHLALRRTKARATTPAGLELLELSRVVDGIVLDKLVVTSGQPGAQVFATGARSSALSNTPLPEGRWRVGPVEWKQKGNWNVHWDGPRSGLGPVWIDLIYEAPGQTARKAIGFHLDANIATSPGSAGCVVLANRADLETLIRWLEGGSIKHLFVDWGLKTCPPVRPI